MMVEMMAEWWVLQTVVPMAASKVETMAAS